MFVLFMDQGTHGKFFRFAAPSRGVESRGKLRGKKKRQKEGGRPGA